MTEEKLRSYIKKELRLDEAQGDFSGEDMKNVWKSFTNVFKVIGTALKSILSALVLNVEILFKTDKNSIEQSFNSYETRSRNITQEYEEVLGPLKEKFESVEPLLFLASPGSYIAYQFTKGGASNFSSTRAFLQDVGIDLGRTDWGNLGLDAGVQAMIDAALGTGPTKNLAGSGQRIENQQRQLQSSLDRIFGMSSQTNESIITEQNDVVSVVKNFLESGIKKIKPEVFGVPESAQQDAVKLKKEQAEAFAKNLDLPTAFLKKMSSAKTLEEVKAAVSVLKDSPYSFEGIDKLTPEFLEKSANNALKIAEKKNKLSALFSEIGAKIPDSEEQKIEVIKAYQLRNLLGTTVLNARESIQKQTQLIKKQYLEKYESDTPLDVLEKIAPDSELYKTVQQGVQKIQNAGKLTE